MAINSDFIKHWKSLGDAQANDPINQFFYYYVAFNCLYENVFIGLSPNVKERERKYDREKIDVFRRSDEYKRCKMNGFNPCQDLRIIPELSKGVEDADSAPCFHSRKAIDPISQTIEQQEDRLFKNIYQVRCNLFHGQKYIITQESRNFNLVKECVGVLNSLLTAFLKN